MAKETAIAFHSEMSPGNEYIDFTENLNKNETKIDNRENKIVVEKDKRSNFFFILITVVVIIDLAFVIIYLRLFGFE